MDFWKEKHTGALFAHGRFCDGEVGEEIVKGALIHDAKDHKPFWLPWPTFVERFEHIELRTSSEAWNRGSGWFIVAMLLGLVGGLFLATLIGLASQGIETRSIAWPACVGAIIGALFAYRRFRRLAADYQWDSWKGKMK